MFLRRQPQLGIAYPGFNAPPRAPPISRLQLPSKTLVGTSLACGVFHVVALSSRSRLRIIGRHFLRFGLRRQLGVGRAQKA